MSAEFFFLSVVWDAVSHLTVQDLRADFPTGNSQRDCPDNNSDLTVWMIQHWWFLWQYITSDKMIELSFLAGIHIISRNKVGFLSYYILCQSKLQFIFSILFLVSVVQPKFTAFIKFLAPVLVSGMKESAVYYSALFSIPQIMRWSIHRCSTWATHKLLQITFTIHQCHTRIISHKRKSQSSILILIGSNTINPPPKDLKMVWITCELVTRKRWMLYVLQWSISWLPRNS